MNDIEDEKRLKTDDVDKLHNMEIGDYRLLAKEKLGHDPVNNLIKGIRKTDNKLVAVKIFRKNYCLTYSLGFPPEEAKILKKLDHPGIIKVYDFHTVGDLGYLFAEYVPGKELYTFLEERRDGNLSEREVKKYALYIANIIDYIHSKCICHRDIKLDNFVLDENGMPKLLDFEFACYYDMIRATHHTAYEVGNNKGKLTTFCGSYDYASPEIFARIPYYGPDVDIWAFGVVMYIMMTQYIPFNTAQKAIECEYKWPPGIPISDNFRNLIASIFVKAPKRINIMQVLNSPWLST